MSYHWQDEKKVGIVSIDEAGHVVLLEPGQDGYEAALKSGPLPPLDVAGHTEPTADEVRRQRDARLAASDWTQVADAPVNSEAWKAYRAALRDVTKQDGFPGSVQWPEAPK